MARVREVRIRDGSTQRVLRYADYPVPEDILRLAVEAQVYAAQAGKALERPEIPSSVTRMLTEVR